ncbi:Gfo/Idh/MocA family oxidoreductase [Candidatus Bathyarchaeota archaeon]|nr:Gfo/Idh/MocA family oxidoreductase [Candidatus Bathyarchaeota archaeon]
MKKVNLGIVGLGFQGKIHLRNCLRIGNAKVLGVADISDKALNYARKFGVKNVYRNYEDLLKDKDLDAVILSLPNFLHMESVVRAAEEGKDIFLEKPLARNLEEGEKIVSAVEKAGVRLMMGFDLRFHPVLRELRNKIDEGYFGEVQVAEATNVSGGPFSLRSDRLGPVPVSSWWFEEELVGGGALLDLGSHMIDLLTWYFGEVDHVECFLKYMFNLDVEDAATCLLKFRKGPLATVKVGWFSKDFIQSIQLCGTARNLYVPISGSKALGKIWKDLKRKVGLYNSDPYYLEIKYFVNCLQRDENPVPSEKEGLKSLRLILSAYESYRKNS